MTAISPSNNRRHVVRRYLLAAATVLVAWGATTLLRLEAPHRPLSLVFFFAAVAITAGFGGLGPGLVATALSALICDFFFLEPLHTLFVFRSDFPLLMLYLCVAVLINIQSERLKAATRAVEQRFHDRVQGLDAIVWAANPQTLQFTFVSQRAESLLGYSIGQWLSEPDFRNRILHADDRDRVLAACRRFVNEGGDHGMEYRVVAQDKREIWLRETVHVVRNERDQPVRLTGLCVDITERKLAEQENAELRDALSTLHEITTAMTASLDLPTVLATLKQELGRHIRVPSSLLFLVDEENSRLYLADSWGAPLPRESGGQRFHPVAPEDRSVPHLGQLAQKIEIGPPLVTLSGVEAPGTAGLAAYLWMPLTANEELQGAVCLLDTSLDRFNAERLDFFETLGRQAGVILQNARLYSQVNSGRAELQRLSQRLVEVQEEERRHIARELHDEIGQVLTGLKFRLETCARSFPGALNENLREALNPVNEMMVQVRELSLDLRPAVLDDLGLLPALVWHFERYTALTGVEVAFDHQGLDRRFAHEVETTAYRLVQEALTNVARHAQAPEAAVRIWASDESLLMDIVDRGQGFSAGGPEQDKRGGLLGMRERVTLLGGRFSIESHPGMGTHLVAQVPLCGARDEAGQQQ
jgi:PAS domain S-box-containing protein